MLPHLIELAAQPILPRWLVLPAAALCLLALAAHLSALRLSDGPGSRRRIRTVNAVIMLLAIPPLVYVLAFATPANPRGFVYAWTLILGLVGLVLMVTGIDIANSIRLHRRHIRRLRTEAALSVAQARGLTRETGDAPRP